MAMRIDIRPDPVRQGGRVLLRAEGAPQENDLFWELVGYTDQTVLTVSEDGLKAYIDTTNLPPNLYEVRLIAQPKHGFAGEPVIADAAFNVEPAPISRDFMENVLKRAENIADRIGPAQRSTEHLATQPGSPTMGGSGMDAESMKEPLAVRVTMDRRFAQDRDSDDNLVLWQTIRNRTEAIKFRNYKDYIDDVLCNPDDPVGLSLKGRFAQMNLFHGVDAYDLLETATQAFLMTKTGVFVPVDQPDLEVPGEQSRIGQTITYAVLNSRLSTYLNKANGLPYLDRIVRALRGRRSSGDQDLSGYPDCAYDPDENIDLRNILLFDEGLRHPLMIELIWNYWHEESMLVQTINAITMRFQNRRGPGQPDPLAHLELDPLRPLNNLLWGYLQEEFRHLTVQRRAYEYDHHYGLSLYGKAVPEMMVSDSRSRFLEAFHNLLTLCTTFYKQSDDTTFNPDPFPLLNSLKEVHLILAQGAHNQFGDLPWTARVEMLTQQWLLARPEMNEYLRGRPMVPYTEEWMGRVDTMKALQGWGDTTATYFNNLAIFGEQLLLSIRYTDWIDISLPGPAGVWALYWRPEIQGYIHAYRAVTGVDLTADVVNNIPAEMRYMRPSELLRRRLAEGSSGNGRLNGHSSGQQNGKAAPMLTGQTPVPAPQSFRERKALRK